MKDSEDLNTVRSAAMRMLARREHATAELRRKLCQRGHAEPDVDTVLEALSRERLLSDERFAESFVHNRLERGYGPLRIRRELEERGVDNELIEQSFESVDIDWMKMAEEVRAKRFGRGLPGDYPERARQSRFLYQRGFSGDQINRLFRATD